MANAYNRLTLERFIESLRADRYESISGARKSVGRAQWSDKEKAKGHEAILEYFGPGSDSETLMAKRLGKPAKPAKTAKKKAAPKGKAKPAKKAVVVEVEAAPEEVVPVDEPMKVEEAPVQAPVKVRRGRTPRQPVVETAASMAPAPVGVDASLEAQLSAFTQVVGNLGKLALDLSNAGSNVNAQSTLSDVALLISDLVRKARKELVGVVPEPGNITHKHVVPPQQFAMPLRPSVVPLAAEEQKAADSLGSYLPSAYGGSALGELIRNKTA